MIEVTALIEGPGVAPQRSSHWRRASAIGSNGRSGIFAGQSVTRGGLTRRTGWMRTDAELLADDFGAFYERHVDTVTAYLSRRTRRPDQTFDLVAETFARALEHRSRYDARRGPAIAWLLGIARNLVVDAARRGRVADAARVRLGMEPITLDDAQLERINERGSVELADALAALP